jgi:hypothetical protein
MRGKRSFLGNITAQFFSSRVETEQLAVVRKSASLRSEISFLSIAVSMDGKLLAARKVAGLAAAFTHHSDLLWRERPGRRGRLR